MQYVNFPENFISTKYPGYFICLKTNYIYSIKIDGVLKRLRLYYPNKFNKMKCPHYQLSVHGKKIYFTESDICILIQKCKAQKIKLITTIQIEE